MNKSNVALALITATALTGTSLFFKNFINPYERVYKIADGDTIILDNNKQTVRLYGIDAPELEHCYGKKAQDRLDQLLKKRQIQIKEPVVDHFRRIVALVYVDGRLINEIMLREGLAAVNSHPGSAREILNKAYLQAKTQKLGIYSSACTDDQPPDPKCAIKGNHDLDRNDDVYLLPTCSHYNVVIMRRFEGDRWFCSEKEAKAAGFTKSPDCTIDWTSFLTPTPKR